MFKYLQDISFLPSTLKASKNPPVWYWKIYTSANQNDYERGYKKLLGLCNSIHVIYMVFNFCGTGKGPLFTYFLKDQLMDSELERVASGAVMLLPVVRVSPFNLKLKTMHVVIELEASPSGLRCISSGRR